MYNFERLWSHLIPMLPAGTRLGPYEIESLVGTGGMGEVYQGERHAAGPHRGNQAARPRDTTSASQHEARAIASLNHPHICQLYDVGADYLVLEFVEGTPLHGPLPLKRRSCAIAIQLAGALEAAHDRGILHRDLKPANIHHHRELHRQAARFRRRASYLIVTPTSPKTTDRAVVGTVAYMSPEQALGKRLDARSDIFSFGAWCCTSSLAGRARLRRRNVRSIAERRRCAEDAAAATGVLRARPDRHALPRRRSRAAISDDGGGKAALRAVAIGRADRAGGAIDRRAAVCQPERGQGERVLRRRSGRGDHQRAGSGCRASR